MSFTLGNEADEGWAGRRPAGGEAGGAQPWNALLGASYLGGSNSSDLRAGATTAAAGVGGGVGRVLPATIDTAFSLPIGLLARGGEIDRPGDLLRRAARPSPERNLRPLGPVFGRNGDPVGKALSPAVSRQLAMTAGPGLRRFQFLASPRVPAGAKLDSPSNGTLLAHSRDQRLRGKRNSNKESSPHPVFSPWRRMGDFGKLNGVAVRTGPNGNVYSSINDSAGCHIPVQGDFSPEGIENFRRWLAVEDASAGSSAAGAMVLWDWVAGAPKKNVYRDAVIARAVGNFAATAVAARAAVRGGAWSSLPEEEGVPTIGGKPPRNSKYAGGVHPSGVRFTKQGFPDFGPYAVKTVRVSGLTGDTRLDAGMANKAASLNVTPKGYTWHHVEDGLTMQLIPSDIHNATGHTAGVAVLKNEGFDP